MHIKQSKINFIKKNFLKNQSDALLFLIIKKQYNISCTLSFKFYQKKNTDLIKIK